MQLKIFLRAVLFLERKKTQVKLISVICFAEPIHPKYEQHEHVICI